MKRHLILLFFFFVNIFLFAQNKEEKKKFDYRLGGYVKYMTTVNIPDFDEDWFTDQLIHNRLNFKWYASPKLTIVAEARNRLIWGETMKLIPNYGRLVTSTNDFIELGGIIAEEKSFVLHSIIDRAYLDWSTDKWQIRLGKQRINWGRAFIWNPNDIFNAYSFFDFDYEERPGADALLIRHYVGVVSSIELVVTAGKDFDDMSIGGLYKFNKKSYDYQVLVGKMKEDLALGFGWAGQLKTVGFKGESSYFHPYNNFEEEGTWISTVDFQYAFKKNGSVQLGAVYNTNPVTDFTLFSPTQSLTAKTQSFSHWSTFGQYQLAITPLVSANISIMWNIDGQSYFTGGGATFSINDNTSFLLTSQIFRGQENSAFGAGGNLVYGRLKWSF